MPVRISKETLYLRHNFTAQERDQMGAELAGCYNQQQELKEEEAAIKAKLKERATAIDTRIGTLSRNYSTGFEMRNVVCSIKYDDPNVGEVSYYDPEGNLVEGKTRPMTEHERQMDLPLDSNSVVVMPPAQSEANIKEFFGDKEGEQPVGAVVEQASNRGEDGPESGEPEPPANDEGGGGDEDEEEEPDEEDEEETEDEEEPEYDPVANAVVETSNGKSGPKELAAFHEQELAKETDKGKKKKKAPEKANVF